MAQSHKRNGIINNTYNRNNMKPIDFKGSNIVFAKDQPEYLPLPAWKSEDGQVVSCWKLSWKERIKLLFTGKMFFMVMTFNKPLQPQLPSVDNPLIFE